MHEIRSNIITGFRSGKKLSLIFLFYTASTALVEGKLSKNLKKILKKIVAKDAHEQLAVADAKLGGVIKVITDFAVYPCVSCY